MKQTDTLMILSLSIAELYGNMHRIYHEKNNNVSFPLSEGLYSPVNSCPHISSFLSVYLKPLCPAALFSTSPLLMSMTSLLIFSMVCPSSWDSVTFFYQIAVSLAVLEPPNFESPSPLCHVISLCCLLLSLSSCHFDTILRDSKRHGMP